MHRHLFLGGGQQLCTTIGMWQQQGQHLLNKVSHQDVLLCSLLHHPHIIVCNAHLVTQGQQRHNWNRLGCEPQQFNRWTQLSSFMSSSVDVPLFCLFVCLLYFVPNYKNVIILHKLQTVVALNCKCGTHCVSQHVLLIAEFGCVWPQHGKKQL